jgi:hypothetical protein
MTDTISITISSNPLSLNLSLGKQAEVDVDGDSVKDVIVGFWSVKDQKAEIFIKLIPSSQTGAIRPSTNITKSGTKTGFNFNIKDYSGFKWIIGLGVAILIVSFLIYRVLRRKMLERRWEKSRTRFKWRPVGEIKTEAIKEVKELKDKV